MIFWGAQFLHGYLVFLDKIIQRVSFSNMPERRWWLALFPLTPFNISVELKNPAKARRKILRKGRRL